MAMAAALRICVMEEGRQAILPMWNLWRQECCRHLVAQTSRGAPFPRALSTGDTRERQGRFEGDPFKERKGLLETSEELFEPRPELKPLG